MFSASSRAKKRVLLKAVEFVAASGRTPTRLAASTSAKTASASSSQDQASSNLVSNHVPEEADTVIIGGGIVGCSIAYHMARSLGPNGVKDRPVVLLEKTDLTAGSTWHAAGLTTAYHPLINLKRLHWYSLNFFNQIEQETEQQVGFHQPGSIRLATEPERMDEFRAQSSHQGWNPAPFKILTPEEIKELVPIIDIEGANILGGLYSPLDGHIDPYSLTMAIAKGARNRGAKLVQRTPVEGLNMNGDGTWNVETSHGRIKANRVVNATGFWGREVARMCDMNLPLIAVHHQYLVTKTLPEVKALQREFPVLRDLDGSFYLRQERDGLLIGPYESADTMKLCDEWARDHVPPGFGKELFEPDIDRLQPHLERAMELVPCFQHAEIQSVVNGPMPYSPDTYPLLGPTTLPNMWLAVGVSYGIAHGAAVGKYLTDWILKGETECDFAEMDPNRFGDWATFDFAVAKVKESYGMNTAKHYPHEDRLAGRPTSRITPIHDDLLNAGAFMGFVNGWEVPLWFSGEGSKPEYLPSFKRTNWHEAMVKEHETVINNVGLKDLTSFSKFTVEGPHAESFLDYLVAGTVPKRDLRTSVTHALTPQGKVYSELTITRLGPQRFMVVSGGAVEGHDFRYMVLEAYKGKYDVSIRNVTDDWCTLSIAGPKSKELIADLTGMQAEEWKFLDAKQCRINNVDVLAIRISYTGELGWELYMDKSGMRDVFFSIMNEGAKYNIGHFGNHAMNALRLEKGFKSWGHEMNLDVTAIEADLEAFVRWNKKSNFIGKQKLLEKRGEVLQNKLVMLSVDVDDADPEGNESVFLGDKVVGNITSGCFSPVLQKGLAFAYVPALAARPGLELSVDILGDHRKAVVLNGPPVLTQPMREKLEKESRGKNKEQQIAYV